MRIVDACIQHRNLHALAGNAAVLDGGPAKISERGGQIRLPIDVHRTGRIIGHWPHRYDARDIVQRWKCFAPIEIMIALWPLLTRPSSTPPSDLTILPYLLLLQLREISVLLRRGHRDSVLLGVGSDYESLPIDLDTRTTESRSVLSRDFPLRQLPLDGSSNEILNPVLPTDVAGPSSTMPVAAWDGGAFTSPDFDLVDYDILLTGTTPEPGTLLLCGGAVLGLLFFRHRRAG